MSSGDFNGDGINDFLTGEFTNDGTLKFLTKLRVYLKNKDNGDFTLSYTRNLELSQHYTSQTSWHTNQGIPMTMDANGDGRDDIILFTIRTSTSIQHSSADYKILLANENATDFLYSSEVPSSGLSYSIPGDNDNCWGKIVESGTNNFVHVGDFDGDGKSDFIAVLDPCFASINERKAILFTPGRVVKKRLINLQDVNVNDWVDASRVTILDFDGDGKSEIMFTKSNGTKIFTLTTSSEVLGTDAIAHLISSPYINLNITNFKVADFNADGKQDLLERVSNSAFKVYLSNGRNTFFPSVHNISTSSSSNYDIGDFDGNGLTDIITYEYNMSVCSGEQEYVSSTSYGLYLNKGNGFVLGGGDDNFPVNSVNSPIMGDFNGDGKTDIYRRHYSGGCYGQGQHIFTFNAWQKNNVLEKVSNGFNQVTEIGYKYLTESGVYTKNKASAYPFNVITAPIKVATYVATPNGIGGKIETTYKYENAQVHRGGLGFLGFSKFESSTHNLVEASPLKIHGTRSITEFDIIASATTPVHYATAVKKQTVKNISNEATLNDELLSVTENTYSFQTNGTRYWQKLNNTTSDNKKTGITTTASYVYDVYGNVTNETATTKTANNSNEETVTSTKSFTGTYGTTVPAHPETVVVSKNGAIFLFLRKWLISSHTMQKAM